MGGYVVRRNTFSMLVVKLEGKRPLKRSRRTWEDNIRMDHREMKWKLRTNDGLL
jgi:hypothetical protein